MGLFSQKIAESNIKFDPQGLNFPLSYNIKQTTEFVFNELKVNYTETNFVWNIDFFKPIDGGYNVQISMVEHRVIKYNEQYKKLIDFMSLFNIPISTLNLKLDENGVPIKVLNQVDILQKWINLRDGELVKLKDDKNIQLILQGGDKDYSNTIDLISSSILYILFLPPAYGSRKSNPLRKVCISSSLYSTENISFAIKETLLSMSNLRMRFLHEANGYSNSDFQKKYKNTYQKMMEGIDFNYNCHYNAHYEYKMNGGILNQVIAELKEETAKGLYLRQTFNIKLEGE